MTAQPSPQQVKYIQRLVKGKSRAWTITAETAFVWGLALASVVGVMWFPSPKAPFGVQLLEAWFCIGLAAFMTWVSVKKTTPLTQNEQNKANHLVAVLPFAKVVVDHVQTLGRPLIQADLAFMEVLVEPHRKLAKDLAKRA